MPKWPRIELIENRFEVLRLRNLKGNPNAVESICRFAIWCHGKLIFRPKVRTFEHLEFFHFNISRRRRRRSAQNALRFANIHRVISVFTITHLISIFLVHFFRRMKFTFYRMHTMHVASISMISAKAKMEIKKKKTQKNQQKWFNSRAIRIFFLPLNSICGYHR